jgi:hypothetical protein
MIEQQIIAKIDALKPAECMRERWQQYSETIQRFVLHVPTQDRDEFVQMVADRLEV